MLADLDKKKQTHQIQAPAGNEPSTPPISRSSSMIARTSSVSSIEDLEVAAQCAASTPAMPDKESFHESHIRINQQMASRHQIDEIRRVRSINPSTPLKQVLNFQSPCPAPPDKRDSPYLDSMADNHVGDLISANKQLADDKRVVTRPVLVKLDVKYLAPLQSPLFKQYYKKTRDSDGKRIPKKHREMDEDLFRALIRPVLRRLLGVGHMHSTDLVGRYYRAAMIVTKKRRANHVQSWRNHGTHKKLIYGGEVPAVGSATPRLADKKPKRRRQKKHPVKKVLFVLQSNGLPQRIVAAMSSEEESQVQQDDDPPPKRPKVDPPQENTSTKGQQAAGNLCVECKKPIDCKDKDSFGKRIRCNKCFDNYIRKTVVPEHHGKIIKKRTVAEDRNKGKADKNKKPEGQSTSKEDKNKSKEDKNKTKKKCKVRKNHTSAAASHTLGQRTPHAH